MKLSGPISVSFFTVLTLALIRVEVESANILFFFGVSSYSHRIGVWPLTEALADRGHSVTFVSPYTSKKPNPKIHDLVPKALKTWVDSWNETEELYELRRSGLMDYQWHKLNEFGLDMCQVLMDDPDFIDWVNKSQFDLVVVDSLCNECAYGMAYKFKAKIIAFNTANPFPWYVDPFGFPDESSWLPDMFFHYQQNQMTFYHRLVSLLNPIYFNYLREVEYFPKLEKMIREKMVSDLPSISELERNVSLLFVNHHYSEDYARPLPPNVVPVGGLHITNSSQHLPKDLEDFLNKGQHGFIYMSFGSYAEISHFPKEIQNVFINTLKKLKNIQVIWKTDIERPANLPENVYTGTWMPQQAILSHSKIRGFITHGGLLGIQEAIVNSVPLIVFPIFAEQDYNANKIESKGAGLQLEIVTITEEQLIAAIEKLLINNEYKRKMNKLSKEFTERPLSALDTAVWWTEFVLRNEDTSSLRPLSIYQSWWKKRQLDIWAFIFLIFIFLLKLVYSLLKIIKWLFLSSDNSVQKSKLKQS